jgi:hypothetical protein
MGRNRSLGRSCLAALAAIVLAGSASACPRCADAEAVDGRSPAVGFAAAAGLLLSGPFVLLGVFGLLLGPTLASAGRGVAVKESA